MREIVIIGGGPAGMSAALAAYKSGCRDILVLEREEQTGGILQQCIHSGFGLHEFKEELTGPEYAAKYQEELKNTGVEIKLGTTVLDLSADKTVTATNSKEGIFQIQAKAVILAMGCRERSKGALNIPGSRPAGIFSAGSAQKMINEKGILPGKSCVILGSGDIGLIMARRMTLEGARVHAVCEVMPYSGGLARNIEQCLNDFNIPLKLSHTVTKIHGKKRLEAVTITQVDEKRCPIPGTEEVIPCDTLLLSVGLIPENELTKKAGIPLHPITGGPAVVQNRETEIEGIFSCGNVLHVHDLVDFVSAEARLAGSAAAAYVAGKREAKIQIPITTDGKVRYTVPQMITSQADTTVYFRVNQIYKNAVIKVKADGDEIFTKKARKLAPGEMESIVLKKEWLKDKKELHVSLEV